MEVLLQIIRREKWMDGKLINVADQIRVWWMDFFCKINTRGAMAIPYLRVLPSTTTTVYYAYQWSKFKIGSFDL